MSVPIDREVYDRGHVTGVLPYDPVRDCVVMIEQFRIAFNEDKVILEAIRRKEKQPRARRPMRLAIDAAPTRMRQMVENRIKAEAASPRGS